MKRGLAVCTFLLFFFSFLLSGSIILYFLGRTPIWKFISFPRVSLKVVIVIALIFVIYSIWFFIASIKSFKDSDEEDS